VRVLLAAEDWGCPPWVVTGEPDTQETRWKWLKRWEFYAAQRSVKHKIDMDKING
jgi:hypothetical protein